jgi:hypothetical protein
VQARRRGEPERGEARRPARWPGRLGLDGFGTDGAGGRREKIRRGQGDTGDFALKATGCFRVRGLAVGTAGGRRSPERDLAAQAVAPV